MSFTNGTLPSDFSTWTYQEVLRAFETVTEETVGKDAFERNRRFVELHDHWQDGDNWVGPGVASSSIALKQRILQAVAPQFTPVDLIGEALDNIGNGLLRREASVDFTPLVPPVAPEDPQDPAAVAASQAAGAKQRAEIDAMVADISKWWDRKGLWVKAWLATRRSRWATRGTLRARVVSSALVTQGTVTGLPTNLEFTKALAAIALSAPGPSTCLVFTHPDTDESVGLFKFVDAAGANCAELWYLKGENTVLRMVKEAAQESKTFAVAMGGRLPIAQMDGKLLITDEVRRQQNRANFFETLLVRIGETAGFPERYTTNAMPQGTWMRTAPTDGPPLDTQVDGDGTKWYLHASPRTIGASITTDLRGVTTTDPTTGKDTVLTPGVERFDPVDPDFAIKSCQHARATLYKNVKQGHLANESTAESSGIAYEQARAVFEADLDTTRPNLEGMIRDIIEAVIALAEHMSGKSGDSFLSRYRCVVNVHISIGPVTPEQSTEIRAQVKDRLRSRESGMAAIGIEDTDAEIQQINQDPAARAELVTSQGEALAAVTGAGSSIEAAAKFLRLSEDDQTALVPSDSDGGDNLP